jgi:outer membrane biosynthesis protein TonB
VKNRIQSLAFVATLAVAFGMISGGSALAQTSPSSTDQATPQTQPTPDTPPTQQTPQTQPTPTPDTPPATQQAPTAQTPDQTAPPASNNGTPSTGTPSNGAPSTGAAAASDSQSFSGTIEKSGDKYVLKDDSGKTYDIDHQTDVAKFEGKRVRVKGTLDSSGTKIMVK